jgi:hypothetical protein
MKTLKSFLPFITLIAISISPVFAKGQSINDSTGLPGDHFSLEAALNLFKNASSVEAFENAINNKNNNVNNLDLNGDGEIDYIRVVDRAEKDVHVLVLQVPVSDNESQDIAVIEIEKTGDTSAILQMLGDEEIYGDKIIVEPDGGGIDEETSFLDYKSTQMHGPSDKDVIYNARIVVNVWLWPSVRFIYSPYYKPWISPCKWHHYPAAWRPWKPYSWKAWQPRVRVRFATPFVVVQTHRVQRAHTFYMPYRSSSVTIRKRHYVALTNYKVIRMKSPRGQVIQKRSNNYRAPQNNRRPGRVIERKRRG